MVCETQRTYQPVKAKPTNRSKSKKIVEKQAKKMGWAIKKLPQSKWELTKPFTKDKMQVEFLESGAIKVIVPGKISAPNHMNAESFLRFIHEEMGGTVEITNLGAGHGHTHLGAHIPHHHA